MNVFYIKRKCNLFNICLKKFSDQIILRERKRKRREKEERKREKKIAEEENKRMGKYPIPKVHIESHKHFPQFQTETLE